MASNPRRPTLLRTLALDPGTRELGYGVLEGTDLLYFGVRTLKSRHSEQRLLAEGQRFVTRLLDTFAPHLFVIEQTFYAKSKRSFHLHGFVDAMLTLAAHWDVEAMAYRSTTVKRVIAGDAAATKRQVAEALLQWYPHLEKYLRTDLRTHEKYWENMFDAVALGLTGYETWVKRRVLDG